MSVTQSFSLQMKVSLPTQKRTTAVNAITLIEEIYLSPYKWVKENRKEDLYQYLIIPKTITSQRDGVLYVFRIYIFQIIF